MVDQGEDCRCVVHHDRSSVDNQTSNKVAEN
jgi:hypothetical protein